MRLQTTTTSNPAICPQSSFICQVQFFLIMPLCYKETSVKRSNPPVTFTSKNRETSSHKVKPRWTPFSQPEAQTIAFNGRHFSLKIDPPSVMTFHTLRLSKFHPIRGVRDKISGDSLVINPVVNFTHSSNCDQ